MLRGMQNGAAPRLQFKDLSALLKGTRLASLKERRLMMHFARPAACISAPNDDASW